MSNMQILLTEEDSFYVDMTDINPELPVYGQIIHAAMDDDQLPNIEIEAKGVLFSEVPLSLDSEQEKFYTNLMYTRFKEIIENSLRKILDGDITEEAINEFNSLSEEELKERKCRQLRNH